MLACWNFADMLTLISSVIFPNLEPAWSTVHPLRNLFSTCKFCMSIARQRHVLACQNYHINWSCYCTWRCCHNTNSWHQNPSPGQPLYLRTSHINSTTTRCFGMLKLCHNTHLNTLYGFSKFGTHMTNGSPPVAFSTHKFHTLTAPRRCMLACWNFAGMLILIPSTVFPNLGPAWWTVHRLGNWIFHLQTSHINSATMPYIDMPKLDWYARLNTLYGLSKFGTCTINGSPPAAFSICKFRMPIAPQCYGLACRNFATMLI
jgi:hypothetical protein